MFPDPTMLIAVTILSPAVAALLFALTMAVVRRSALVLWLQGGKYAVARSAVAATAFGGAGSRVRREPSYVAAAAASVAPALARDAA